MTTGVDRPFNLADLVARAAGMLRGLGIEQEDRCALILCDGPEFIATFLGAVRIGAVPVPFSTLLMPAEIRYQLANCGAKAVIASDDATPRVDEARAGLDVPLALLAAGGALRSGWLSYDELARTADLVTETSATGEDERTTGASGSTRAGRRTRAAATTCSRSAASGCRRSRSRRASSTTPPSSRPRSSDARTAMPS